VAGEQVGLDVVDVDPRPRADRPRGEPDHLPVLPDRLPLGDIAQGDLVPQRDRLAGLDGAPPPFEPAPPRDRPRPDRPPVVPPRPPRAATAMRDPSSWRCGECPPVGGGGARPPHPTSLVTRPRFEKRRRLREARRLQWGEIAQAPR